MSRNVRISLGIAIALTLAIVLAVQLSKRGPTRATAGPEDYMARTQIALGGTLRNFTPRSQPGGHPDFARPANAGWGRYALVVEDMLDDERKPVLRTRGHKMTTSWQNAEGTSVGPFKQYVTPRTGDIDATIDPVEGGAVTTPDNFAQWFRDDPALNTTQRNAVVLVRQPDNTYLFDDRVDHPDTGVQEDFDFTHSYEIDTVFVYKPGRDWYIDLGTDADVWLYIDDRLVIDGGAGTEPPFMFAGIALDGELTMRGTSSIGLADGTVASVSTNSTDADAIRINNSAVVSGHLLVGPGGNPDTGIEMDREDSVQAEVGALEEPIVIDSVIVPTDLPPSSGNLNLSGTGVVIDRDVHFSNIELLSGARIGIRGHVRMLVDGDVQILESSRIVLAPESSLELYVGGLFEVRNSSTVNANTQDSSLVQINVFGTTDINIDNRVKIYANFLAPDAGMDLGNNSTVYGSFHGESLDLANSGAFVVVDPLAGERDDANYVDISMTQRIELDRLGWLREDGTHRLKIMFAERSRPRSQLRIETNILTLNVAGTPKIPQFD
jgi:hypothetical protein